MQAHHGTAEPAPKRSLWSELSLGWEWAALRLSPVYYGAGVPRGDGAPVIVVPGFLATDISLAELHLWLGRVGYRPYTSGIGLNAECPDIMLEQLHETIDRAYRETGRRVRLIGHSLGGLLVRAAAAREPGKVAQVITLGTPAQRLVAHPLVMRLLRRVLRLSFRRVEGACLHDFKEGLRECLPPSVERASICSSVDPVVGWRDCVGLEGGPAIMVRGTHSGLVVNAQVYRELGALLAPRQRNPELLRPSAPPTNGLALAA